MQTPKKIKLLMKLFDAKLTDEKTILNADFKKILDIPEMTIPEMKEFVMLQTAIKENKLISWLVDDKSTGDTSDV